ncbi:MAG TPA: LPS export ABC transporter permease LptG [Woeseiaceae bacterium]
MRILTGYLLRTIVKSTLLVLLVLLALGGLFEFIGQLDNVQGNFGIPDALLFAALRLPQLSFEMLPIATLIGSLLGLGGLATSSELVVMRTAGISVLRLIGMVAVAGVVLTVLTALIGEFIGPPLDYFARNLRNEAIFEHEENPGNAAWIKDGPIILHLERINTEFELGGIYVYRFNDDNSLAAVARAENAGIDARDQWILENYRATRFVEGGVEVKREPVQIESFDIAPEVLEIALVKPISLSARGLMSYIAYLRQNGLSAERYAMELWSRISRTATVVVMPVLALAFVFGSLRSAGAGTRLMIGVLVGLLYFLASEMLASSGQVFNLNPAVVSWFPSLALVLITAFALSRVR